MSARAVFCLIGFTTPLGMARGASDDFAPSSYVGSADPHVIWELAIGSIVLCSFLAAVTLWVLAALRGAKRSQLSRNAFVSSALNNLSQGVVITDAQNLIVLCNDRYLEIYGLSRSDLFPGHNRARAGSAAARARHARSQRGRLLRQCPDARRRC